MVPLTCAAARAAGQEGVHMLCKFLVWRNVAQASSESLPAQNHCQPCYAVGTSPSASCAVIRPGCCPASPLCCQALPGWALGPGCALSALLDCAVPLCCPPFYLICRSLHLLLCCTALAVHCKPPKPPPAPLGWGVALPQLAAWQETCTRSWRGIPQPALPVLP